MLRVSRSSRPRRCRRSTTRCSPGRVGTFRKRYAIPSRSTTIRTRIRSRSRPTRRSSTLCGRCWHEPAMPWWRPCSRGSRAVPRKRVEGWGSDRYAHPNRRKCGKLQVFPERQAAGLFSDQTDAGARPSREVRRQQSVQPSRGHAGRRAGSLARANNFLETFTIWAAGKGTALDASRFVKDPVGIREPKVPRPTWETSRQNRRVDISIVVMQSEASTAADYDF